MTTAHVSRAINSHQQPVVVAPAVQLPACSQLGHATINLKKTKAACQKHTLPPRYTHATPTAIQAAIMEINYHPVTAALSAS
jgi:hypothetical protein